MSRELFTAVIQGLCDIYKLDPAHVEAGGAVEMDGVKFCLFHDKESDSPYLMAYCDFGPVPKSLEAQVYKKLLESNLSTYSGQGETFCVAPDGHVVFVNNYPLELLTPTMLAGYLAMTSFTAKKWREGYFLDDGESEATKKKSQSEYFTQKIMQPTK